MKGGFMLRTIVLSATIATTSLAAPPAPRSIAWVLELHHGLDHASQAQDLKSQIAAARAGGAKIVCVEFKGALWRIDVAQAVGEVLAASEPPALAFIASDSGEAPLAFLIAGGRASRGCIVQSGVVLVASASGNARELAETKPITSAESFWKKSDTQSPFAPYDALRAAILNPALGCWMLTGDSNRIEIGAGTPIAPSGAIILSEPGAPTLSLRAQDAVALGLVSSTAPDARAALDSVLASLDGSKPEVRERRPVGAQLQVRRDRAESLLESAAKSMDLAEPHLKLKPESTEIAPGQKREAALLAKPGLDSASSSIAEAESIFNADPEILRLPGPGQADTGQTPAQFQARWRSRIQQAKDRLDKLKAKARKLAGA